MSNRIDFIQSSKKPSAIPAATVTIMLDGELCPKLELKEIVREGWPKFSRARLAVNRAAYPDGDAAAAENIEAEFAMGQSVSIRQCFNGVPPGAAAFSYPVFDGRIEAIETKLESKGETVEITARDFSANIERITVYGRRIAKADGSSILLAGMDTAFNPDGKANADAEPIEANGRRYTVFCEEPSQGRAWSYAEVIDYLLSEYLPNGRLQRPGIEQLKAVTENQIVRDLDVTGLSLIEALHRCCERIGLRFKFVPRPVESGPVQAIVFYKSGAGREVELNLQQAAQQLDIAKTNIARMQSSRNLWPVTNKYLGQGDFKVYEATFELVKGWDGNEEQTDYDIFSPSSNTDFYQVKDVFRKWALNEAGDYTDEPYNRGQAYDFAKIFGSENYAHRRRRFYPSLTRDNQGKSLGYFLEVSYDSGANWRQYLSAFNNLLDECGLWLSSDRLDVETWVAALKGSLRFRITASVISDERLSCELSDGPVNSTAAVVEHLITLPRMFKYRKVSNKSIFAGSSDTSLGIADEVDDSTALYEYIRHMALDSARTIETFEIQTPSIELDYRIGDRIAANPEGRDLLSCRSDNRSISWIERVRMDFEKQCTNLKVVRKRRVEL